MLIYKIMSSDEWNAFKAHKTFHGSEVDVQDGFIHFSTKEQAIETANKHFVGQSNLILEAVDEERLGDTLVYETSRGGALFPHFYEPLKFSTVVDSIEFEPDVEGKFQFPQDFS